MTNSSTTSLIAMGKKWWAFQISFSVKWSNFPFFHIFLLPLRLMETESAQLPTKKEEPDEPFHNFRTSRLGDRRNLCRSKMSIGEF